jgi:hypothetical protein
MGNDTSKIAEETGMREGEVTSLRARFDYLATPIGEVVAPSRDSLSLTLFVAKFPESQQQLAGMLFTAMDARRKGVVEFADFARAVALLSNGAPSNVSRKIGFGFEMYDSSGAGAVTRDDVLRAIGCYRRTIVAVMHGAAARVAGVDGREPLDVSIDLLGDDDLADRFFVLIKSQSMKYVVVEVPPASEGVAAAGRCCGAGPAPTPELLRRLAPITRNEFHAFAMSHPAMNEQADIAFLAVRRAAMFDWQILPGQGQRRPSALPQDCCVM